MKKKIENETNLKKKNLKIVKSKNVSVRIPIGLYEEYQEAREIALRNKRHLSLSAIIRNSVEEYIERAKSLKSKR